MLGRLLASAVHRSTLISLTLSLSTASATTSAFESRGETSYRIVITCMHAIARRCCSADVLIQHTRVSSGKYELQTPTCVSVINKTTMSATLLSLTPKCYSSGQCTGRHRTYCSAVLCQHRASCTALPKRVSATKLAAEVNTQHRHDFGCFRSQVHPL